MKPKEYYEPWCVVCSIELDPKKKKKKKKKKIFNPYILL
jgi:hypothetical protein